MQKLTERSFAAGQEIFQKGDKCDHVLIYIHGSIHYSKEDHESCRTQEPIAPDFGTWICEPALWLSWHYRGVLVAVKIVIMLQLTVKEFQSWMAEDVESLNLASKFA